MKANSGYKHPLAAAIRKYGKNSFTVETIVVCDSFESACAAEIEAILVLENRYNISPGGDTDGRTGSECFKELLKDPEWRAKYVKNLSAGIKASGKHNTPERLENMKAHLAEWRKNNPKEAYIIQRRATRCAARENTTTGVKTMQKANKAPNRMQSIRRRKNAVAKVWRERSPEEIEIVGSKISAGVKKAHESKTPEERKAHEQQLAKARKNIDHNVRKTNQKEALKNYWTEERRKAFGESVKKIWEKRRENV